MPVSADPTLVTGSDRKERRLPPLSGLEESVSLGRDSNPHGHPCVRPLCGQEGGASSPSAAPPVALWRYAALRAADGQHQLGG